MWHNRVTRRRGAGEVVEGMDVVRLLEKVATDMSDRPRQAVTISDCGQVGVEEEAAGGSAAGSTGAADLKGASWGSAEGGDGSQHASGHGKREHGDGLIGASMTGGGAQADDDEQEHEADLEAATKGMTPMERRLFALRMKLNKSRKANKAETENEYRRSTDPTFEARQRRQERHLEQQHKQQAGDGDSGHADDDAAASRWNSHDSDRALHVTAEEAARRQEKARAKELHKATFGWGATTAEGRFGAYQKRADKLPMAAKKAGGEGEEIDPFMYGAGGAQVPLHAKERISREIEAQLEARRKKKMPRGSLDAADVDYINDRNAAFNKRVKKSYDKYSVEVRQNIERGTAI